MNDGNATAIRIGVAICAMFLLFLYLRDYTQFFERLFCMMGPEEYYKEKNYIGLYRRFKHCTTINGLGKLRQILLKYADLPVWQVQNDGAILQIRTL